MHAYAIITAPMTNTKSEPIANLKIQGIASSNSRSAQLLLKLGYGRLHQPVGRYLYLLFPESQVTILAGAFQFEIGMKFRFGQHEMDCFPFTVGLSLTECRKLVDANGNDVWIVGAHVEANDLAIFVT
jgi:hypothetical protein